MPDVACVTTCQIGHPMPLFVLVEPDNRLFQCVSYAAANSSTNFSIRV